MGLLEKWKPSMELNRFRREFDELIERFGFDREFFADWEALPKRPAIETRVEDGKFIARADLPGVEPKDVELKAIGNVLTIKGSREERHEGKKANFFRREIRYGAFERSVSLPEGIKAEDLKATYRDGVMELSAPMPKEAIPKQIKIQIEAPKGNSEKKGAA